MISIAIEPKTTADMDKLGQSLDRLADRRSHRSRWRRIPKRVSLIISGMGELHLEIIVDRSAARVQCRTRTSVVPRLPTKRRFRSRADRFAVSTSSNLVARASSPIVEDRGLCLVRSGSGFESSRMPFDRRRYSKLSSWFRRSSRAVGIRSGAAISVVIRSSTFCFVCNGRRRARNRLFE